MPRTIAIINVRMGSQRLPGKTMRTILGRPMLGHLLDRVKQVQGLDGIVVATPESRKNDVIETFCRSENVSCFRGSEDDVLSRMLGALRQERADVGMEIYGDGPLTDPRLLEECLQIYLERGTYDLVGNDMKPGYPSGMYTETFSMRAFEDSATRTNDPAVREHGTLFLRQHPELYNIKHVEAQGALRRPDLHLDVDTEFDFTIIEAIVTHFAPRNDFSLAEIIAFLDAHPELAKSNQHVERRWKKYQRS